MLFYHDYASSRACRNSRKYTRRKSHSGPSSELGRVGKTDAQLTIARHANFCLSCSTQAAELVNIIILDFWYSEHSSEDRIIFMTACPLLSRIWKDVFGSIVSQDIHVPSEGYLLYLNSIIRNNNSLIYRFHLPHSLRTITCYVDLVDTTWDAAQEPYTILFNLPNLIGFRKCFPNLTKITLEIKYRVRGRCFRFILSQRQLIQTRITIALDQATTQFSVLPVHWEIIAYKPSHPDPDRNLNWEMFLEDVTRCMAPGALSCFKKISFQDMLSQSTYLNGVRRFSGHCIHTEC